MGRRNRKAEVSVGTEKVRRTSGCNLRGALWGARSPLPPGTLPVSRSWAQECSLRLRGGDGGPVSPCAVSDSPRVPLGLGEEGRELATWIRFPATPPRRVSVAQLLRLCAEQPLTLDTRGPQRPCLKALCEVGCHCPDKHACLFTGSPSSLFKTLNFASWLGLSTHRVSPCLPKRC